MKLSTVVTAAAAAAQHIVSMFFQQLRNVVNLVNYPHDQLLASVRLSQLASQLSGSDLPFRLLTAVEVCETAHAHARSCVVNSIIAAACFMKLVAWP